MNRWLRGILLLILIGTGLTVFIYLALRLYLYRNEDKILTLVREEVQDRIQGELEIEGLDFALFRHPGEIAIDLKGVRLRDSLWDVHKVTLFEARALGIVFHPWELLGTKKEWKGLYLEGASLNLFFDSLGYSNLSALRSEDPEPQDSSKKKASPLVRDFWIQGMNWSVVDLAKAKSFSGRFHRLRGEMFPRSWGWTLSAAIDLQINDFAFNTAKGSFMEGERLKARWEAHFHDRKKLLVLKDQRVRIGEDQLALNAVFRFYRPQDRFFLELETQGMEWNRATELVTEDIRGKLSRFNLRDPIPMEVSIDGRMKYLDTPKVDLVFQLQNNQLRSGEIRVDSLWLKGSFTNYLHPGQGHGDANSKVLVKEVKGSLLGLPFQSDSVAVTRLKDPEVFLQAKGDFPLVRLKEVLPPPLVKLYRGQMRYDIQYEGPLSMDRGRPSWKGFVEIRGGKLDYMPRQLQFEDLDARLRLEGVDLYMEEVLTRTGNSRLKMKGRTRDLLTYFYRNPKRVGFHWEVTSPWVDLEDFHSFLSPRQNPYSLPFHRPRKGSFGDQMEKVLAKSLARVEVKVDSLSYRQFQSRKLEARLILGERESRLPHFEIEHAGGKIKADVVLEERITGTAFQMEAAIQHVDVKRLFYGFEDFGQSALSYRHLEGIFSAGVRLKGRFLITGELEPRSLDGQVDFELREGGLIQYEPLEKVGRFVFKNRNLEELRFKEMANRLDIHNGMITIHPMWIQSTALNLKVYGEYGLHGSTDIHLEIPLRNPQKDEMRRKRGLRIRDRKKGIVVYLRVQDQPDGSMSIGWDEDRGGSPQDSLWAH